MKRITALLFAALGVGTAALGLQSASVDPVPAPCRDRVELRPGGDPLDFREPLERLADCLAAARSSGNRALEADLLRRRAELEGARGRWKASRTSARMAVRAARAAGDAGREAWSLNALGDALYGLWRFEEAADRFRAALERFREIGDPYGEATALKNYGILQAHLGRRDLALIYLERALERRPEGAEELDVSILGNLGTIYWRLGAPGSALEAYEEALALARHRRRPDEVSDLEGRIGYLLLWLGRPEEGREHFVSALDAAAEAGPTADLPLLEGAAHAFEVTGHERRAEELLELALAKHRELEHTIAVCLARVSLGGLHEEPGRPGRALEQYERARAMGEAGGIGCRWQSAAGSARAISQLGDRDEAIAHYLEAIDLLDSDRKRFLSDHDRTAFLARAEGVYRELATHLLERGRERGDGSDRELAFHVLERARAPGLAWAIAEARADAEPWMPPEQQRHLDELHREIEDLRQRVADRRTPDRELPALEQELSRRELELDEHLAVPRRAAAARFHREPLSAAAVVDLLPSDTALVSYLLDEEKAFAFVVTAEGVRMEALPTNGSRVAEQVAGFLDLLGESDHPGWKTVGAALFRDLVEPWRTTLDPGIRRLVLVPDGALSSLPFEALPETAEPLRLLIEDLAVSYAASATALADLPHRRPVPGERNSERERPVATGSASLLLLADPNPTGGEGAEQPLRALYEEDGHDLSPVPYGRLEARKIARLTGDAGRLLIGREASERNLEELDLEEFAVLHFATHGLLSPLDPRRSALLLAPGPDGREDGFLQAREIDDLRLEADLVVLSACRTARDQSFAGPGVRSLAEAFFHAGAASVVGTLWEVDDRAAMELMSTFYRHLADGLGKAEALRAAKLDTIADGAEPGEWAGFVLLGEPFAGVAIRPSGELRPGPWIAGLALLVGVLAFAVPRLWRFLAVPS